MDKTRDRPTQIKQCVHFDRRFGRAEIGPREQRKAQIDRWTVERIHGVGKIKPDGVLRIKLTRAADQNGGEVGPVAHFVRVRQR